ncbi:MAG: 4-hydroxybenzoate octaprenyltransferase [Turneriella sp.]
MARLDKEQLPVASRPRTFVFFDFLRMIRFSHTLFALPFALSATLLIAVRHRTEISVTPLSVLWIVVAFTGMRSFAMAANRLLDRHIDALNPRTRSREIPAGLLSVRAVMFFAFVALVTTVVAGYLLAPIAGILALPAALIVAGYSLAKRFTSLCHFWLGAAIGMAPPAVYIALLQRVPVEAFLMQGILTFYIAGFDILYALQDIEFDRAHGLHSVPARFGAARAMYIARASHLIAAALSAALIIYLQFSAVTWLCFALLVALFTAEHYLVGPAQQPRYDKIPVAFFHVNSAFSLTFLATVAAGVFTTA